jgi:hypothetical protein
MEQQNQQFDVKMVFADHIANIAKSNVALTEAFNMVYVEALRLQEENKQLKEEILKRK